MKETNSFSVSILGCGVGRFGAALLAKQKGYLVFVSDKKLIKQEYKDRFVSLGIIFEENTNSKDRILQCDILIKSPGISLDDEIIKEAKNRNIQVLDEISFACQYTNAKLIGVTGSNGKSTVVNMIYKILHDNGRKVEMCGNLDVSLALSIYEQHDVGYYVLELSSFQLECFEKTHLDIACIVNISSNHIDHHKTFEKYIDAKLNIIKGLTKRDFFIFNEEDKNIIKDANIAAKKIQITYSDVKYFDQNILEVKGDHNIFDAIMATNVCLLLDISKEKIFKSLSSYKGLEYRIEFVKKINNVIFINDSKSTTIGSTIAAFEFVRKYYKDSKIIWLAGGYDKGNDYSKLFPFIPYMRKIICIGKDNSKIKKAFDSDLCFEELDMSEIIAKSLQIAQKDDVVLLSPACASYDVYKNYEQRGEIFSKEVNLL